MEDRSRRGEHRLHPHRGCCGAEAAGAAGDDGRERLLCGLDLAEDMARTLIGQAPERGEADAGQQAFEQLFPQPVIGSAMTRKVPAVIASGSARRRSRRPGRRRLA